MNKQDLPCVFETGQAPVTGEPQYLRIAIQPEKGLSIFYDILPQK
jgi:hypothetical protein